MMLGLFQYSSRSMSPTNVTGIHSCLDSNAFLYLIGCNEPGCGTIESSFILVHRSQTAAWYLQVTLILCLLCTACQVLYLYILNGRAVYYRFLGYRAMVWIGVWMNLVCLVSRRQLVYKSKQWEPNTYKKSKWKRYVTETAEEPRLFCLPRRKRRLLNVTKCNKCV